MSRTNVFGLIMVTLSSRWSWCSLNHCQDDPLRITLVINGTLGDNRSSTRPSVAWTA